MDGRARICPWRPNRPSCRFTPWSASWSFAGRVRGARPGRAARGGAAPVMLWLHGGNGPDGFAARTRAAFERCWAEGSLPSMAVVIPHSTRSFWLDGVGRSTWESMLIDELLDHARVRHDVGGPAVIGGISMGGLGALRAAFRHSDLFSAVVALEPGIEPAEEWAAVSTRDRFYRSDELVASLFGDPVDPDRFRSNHPMFLAAHHAVEIAASGLSIYLECGDLDMLALHHGAEALHRRLWDLGLVHEYRSVRGADHVGRSLGPRVVDALRFVGRALDPDTTRPDPERDAAAEFARAGHEPAGFRRHHQVSGPAGPIEVWEYGDQRSEYPSVVMLPSLGRGAADFDDLALRLARAGYHAVHAEPRGIGGSTGELTGLTMADLAADTAAVIHAVADGPVTLVGHAFGNRVARMTATEYPHLVDSVVLLACGGRVPPAPAHAEALLTVFDAARSDDERRAAVAAAFFAPGNDASVWAGGWHGDVAAAQAGATQAQPVDHWWGAGGKEMFVVQPADDVMAVAENARLLCDEFGDRVSMTTVPHAGHALLPEQPAAVEVALRTWLARPR
ncbi:MAG: alpha/beta fold hydrolase [Acidimicrobiales bacterium]